MASRRLLWNASSATRNTLIRRAIGLPLSARCLTHHGPSSSTTSPRSQMFSSAPESSTQSTSTNSTPNPNPNTTHYKITLQRSAISLGSRIKDTLTSLGIHRRFQTMYHRHGPEAAGKILKVKELVHVENVEEGMVKSKEEMRRERRAKRGYVRVGPEGKRSVI
ncbi:hypothetical protein F5878DRAFT_599601 [Lentinula raphanica]|uniref:Large ribosomal subunit protein uL30m n=1 Tax=Lentinula raphanica TaxID=153919 RepID=A0AA38PMJ1_9AGAR|nr:hypothetical protein F5880DRAFT_1067477 [Lentinula raphanica]KAJ3845335.1 hypothetical protein F5878DRAFT_599601 [Lentinula raphanica]